MKVVALTIYTTGYCTKVQRGAKAPALYILWGATVGIRDNIIVEESTSTNSLKRLIPRLKSIIVVGEIEVSNLYKTFLDLLL